MTLSTLKLCLKQMKDTFNTLLVHIFYTLGDTVSKLPDWYFGLNATYDFYSWCMQKSQHFDEKLDHKFWTSNN